MQSREPRDIVPGLFHLHDPRAADVNLPHIQLAIENDQVGPALKEMLTQALSIKGEWDAARKELAQVVADLQRLNQDQDRIRKNLRETPAEAEVYKTYLKKLNDQEKEIDALTAKQKKLMGEEFAARKRLDDYLANLTTE